MDSAKARYEQGQYKLSVQDGVWKAGQMASLLESIQDKSSIRRYADVGCGPGDVLVHLRERLLRAGFPLEKVYGYDIAPFPEGLTSSHPEILFRQADVLDSDECFDLVTANDVLEHMSAAQKFLERIAKRTRYLAIHMPLDDRLSVLFTNQYNYRLREVGHLNFWNPSSAINLITSAGIQPLRVHFTPGFMAPSGRERPLQLLAMPIRFLIGTISCGLAASTVGGYSLAILGRGMLP